MAMSLVSVNAYLTTEHLDLECMPGLARSFLAVVLGIHNNIFTLPNLYNQFLFPIPGQPLQLRPSEPSPSH
nr:BPK_HP1_G0043980.mRNA.1.CDS.1 [Saccharomyces cerevisiae]